MKIRSWLIYLFTLLTDLLGALAALALIPFGARGFRFERPPAPRPGLYALSFEVPRLPGGYAGLTMAPHVIAYARGRRVPGKWTTLQGHEHRHCEQYEVAGLIGTLIACFAFFNAVVWWLALLAYVGTPWAIMGAGYAVAWLRGEDPYRGAAHEEAAYALQEEDHVH